MSIRRYIPNWTIRAARVGLYATLDFLDKIRHTTAPMTPPRMTSLIVGSGDYKAAGLEFLDHFRLRAGLGPRDRVLEIGSGYGRMAVALTNYLASEGAYDGIEIIPDAVEWSKREITSRFKNFSFHHADVSNPYSNPTGALTASHYKLPFDNETFDFVFLTSVFSHMLPIDIDAYLSEISRVTKHGGKSLITLYLLTDFSRQQIESRSAWVPFKYHHDGFMTTSNKTKENTIAIPEVDIRAMYSRHSLAIQEPILYGSWAKPAEFHSFQDMIVSTKL